MVRNIPSFMFCYKFYLVIKKNKAKVNTCVDIAKLYETLTLNVITIFKIISK